MSEKIIQLNVQTNTVLKKAQVYQCMADGLGAGLGSSLSAPLIGESADDSASSASALSSSNEQKPSAVMQIQKRHG